MPVYNEERVLAAGIRSLHRFLADLPFAARIVIRRQREHRRDARHRSRSGPRTARCRRRSPRAEGSRVLRAAWSASEADVACYMDVDLSTDLNALEPPVAPLLAGHSYLATGSRLMFGSHVRRQIKREGLSRVDNWLVRSVLRARFSDAQCGFKAILAEALGLVEDVRDEGWFFDTELLVLAQRAGLRIHEVPVNWIEDPDSRVRIIPTALADLRGVVRLAVAGAFARWVAPPGAPAVHPRATAGGS